MAGDNGSNGVVDFANCFTVFCCEVPAFGGGRLITPPVLRKWVPVQTFRNGFALYLGDYDDSNPCFIPLSHANPPAIFVHGTNGSRDVSLMSLATLVPDEDCPNHWRFCDVAGWDGDATVFICGGLPLSCLGDVKKVRWIKGVSTVLLMRPLDSVVIAGHHILSWENGKMTLEIDS